MLAQILPRTSLPWIHFPLLIDIVTMPKATNLKPGMIFKSIENVMLRVPNLSQSTSTCQACKLVFGSVSKMV